MVVLCLAIGVAGDQILYSKSSVEPFGLAIVDQEDSKWSHMIMDMVGQMETATRLCDIQMLGESEAREKLEAGEVVAIITIPPSFVQDVMSGKNTPVTVEKKEGTMLEGLVVDKLITAGAKLLSSAQVGIYATLDAAKLYGKPDEKHYNMLLQEVNLVFAKQMLARNQMYLEKEVVATGSMPIILHYLLSGFIMMLMLSLMLVMPIIEPLNKGEMFMRYKVAKVKASTLIIQRWISLTLFNVLLGSIGMVGLGIITRFSNGILGEVLKFDISIKSFLGICLAAASLAAIGILIGLLLKGKEAYGVFIFLIVLIQTFLSGGMIPSAYLPNVINRLGHFTYNKYAISLFGGLFGIEVYGNMYLGAGIILCVGIIGSIIILRKRGIRL